MTSDSTNAPDPALDVLARHAVRHGRRFTICRIWDTQVEDFWNQPTDPDIRRPYDGGLGMSPQG